MVGIVERKGRAVAPKLFRYVGSDTTLLGMVREHVLPDSSMVYTDELKAYGGIKALRSKEDNSKSAGYQHRRINHSSKVYVVGDIHTNSVEGFLVAYKARDRWCVSARFRRSICQEATWTSTRFATTDAIRAI